MNFLDSLLYFAIGLISGFVGSMVGLGGGFISNPVLLNIGVNPKFVVSSTKFMVLLVSASSSAKYAFSVSVSAKLYLSIAIPMTVFSFITAYLVAILNREVLLLVVSSILLAVSIRIVASTLTEEGASARGSEARTSYLVPIASGALAGSISGITGLAGGLINMPTFLYVLKLSSHEAVALSMTSMVPSAFMSMARHVIDDIVNWNIAVPLGLGGLAGGYAGPRIALKINRERLRLLIGVVILIATARVLIETLIAIAT